MPGVKIFLFGNFHAEGFLALCLLTRARAGTTGNLGSTTTSAVPSGAGR